MQTVKRTTGERGFSSLELTLTMPLIVFSILFLIGMGHALITKQHAVVGAQFAANHHRVLKEGPSAAAVGQAVSAGTEVFRVAGGGDDIIDYTASTTPQKGLIAERYQLNDAVSKYQTVINTRGCPPDCEPLVGILDVFNITAVLSGVIQGTREKVGAEIDKVKKNKTPPAGGDGGQRQKPARTKQTPRRGAKFC